MIFIRMNSKAENELKKIAKSEGLSVSEYVREIINEKLEDLYDLKIGQDALEKYNKDHVTFTMARYLKNNAYKASFSKEAAKQIKKIDKKTINYICFLSIVTFFTR